MQVPILSGVYIDADTNYRTSYPRNLIPVYKFQGISKGYLRPADGLITFADTSGIDRGGINWKNICYRVLGTKLCSVSSNGTIIELGDIGGYISDYVTFGYSFDSLAVASDRHLFYWDATNGVRRVTDPDLGEVITFIWVDGYFMCSDGKTIVVTELNDPFSVNPIKYASSEVTTSPIVGLVKLHDAPYAVHRYIIEAYQNVGGSGFPFSPILGSTIMRGAVGNHAFCVFGEVIAFLGGGENEAIGVYTGLNAQSVKISTREIDMILQDYTEETLASSVIETRILLDHQFLYIHLPDQTLVYDAIASIATSQPIWFILTSSVLGLGRYRARGFVRCYNKWIVGDPTSNKLGYTSDTISSHYSMSNGWEFGTIILYNKTNGAEFHEMELVGITGNVAPETNPTIWTSHSTDGRTWSRERPISVGKQGQRAKRLAWLQMGNMLNWRIQKFRGTSDANIAVAALECRIEPLYD